MREKNLFDLRCGSASRQFAFFAMSLSRLSSPFFCWQVFESGKETEIFCRWSGVTAEHGNADSVRDIRGFALKFYTEEGE